LAVDKLTQSELRVAMAVARGLTNRQAAIELYLSTKTVDYYLQSIYRKLGVRTRTEMARVVVGGG
jgi:DNA-binding NarL/FixJ family response regulator